jgi:hypothetical protein
MRLDIQDVEESNRESVETFRLDDEKLAAVLDSTPVEGSEAARRHPVSLALPLPDGTYETFRIEESPVFGAATPSRVAHIRTYRVASQQSSIYGRIVHRPSEVDILLHVGDDLVRIRSLEGDSTGAHVSYLATRALEPFECSASPASTIGPTGNEDAPPTTISPDNPQPNRSFSLQGPGSSGGSSSHGQSDGTRRTYRLLVAVDESFIDYSGFADEEDALAQMQAIVMDLRDFFGRELDVDFELHPDSFTFTPHVLPCSCFGLPYCLPKVVQAFNAFTCASDLPGACDYDVGHLFGYAASGWSCANVDVVCTSSVKMSGASFLRTPDASNAYQLVAHELGHQFGANHTWSGEVGSCHPTYNQFSPPFDFEPGGGTTRMAYPGLCEPQELGFTDYYHLNTLQSILASPPSCGDESASENAPPVVAGLPHPIIRIPTRASFVLTGSATDPDGDFLRYTWEQMDQLGQRSNPLVDDPGPDPLFRSLRQGPFPSGYVFAREFLDKGLVGEIVPTRQTDSTNPAIEMCLTARDGKGGFDAKCATIVVQGGPFFLRAGYGVQPGDAIDLEWSSTGTQTLAPNVRVLYSTDGGSEFVEAAACTPNDGLLEDIGYVPCGESYVFRIEGLDSACERPQHYFFDEREIPVYCACPPTRECGGEACLVSPCNLTYYYGLQECWNPGGGGPNPTPITICPPGQTIHILGCDCQDLNACPPGWVCEIQPNGCDNQTSSHVVCN